MATPFNETPKWFIADFYLEAKLANLIAEDPKGNWTRASLVEAFTASGFENPYDHYLAYGDMEALSPNPLFNNTEYLADKAAAMGSTWTPEMVAKAIADADMTLMQHYEMFGSAEGLSPSSDFNQDKYYEAKLEQLQTAEPDKAWTLDTLKAAFAAAGLTPLDHYLEYAAVEGLDEYDYSDNGDPIPHPGNKIALTKGADTATPDATVEGFKTSGRDDAISAIAGSSTTGTLTAGDVIDGGAGVDTLTVDMQANYTFKSGSIKNVEKIVLNNKGGYTFDAKGVEAADLYTVNGGDKGMTIKNVDGTETGYSLTQTAGKFDVQIDDTALKGKADNVNITLNGVGTVSTDDAKEDSIVSLTVAGTKSGVVEGVTLLAAQGTDNLVNLTKGHETVGVKGAGNVDVTVVSGLKTFDASAATGEVIANLGSAGSLLKTITGGKGDDSITVSGLVASAVVDGGEGADTLDLGALGSGSNITNAITGVETFEVTATTTNGTSRINLSKIEGLETFKLTGGNITALSDYELRGATAYSTLNLEISNMLVAAGDVLYDGAGELNVIHSGATSGSATDINALTVNNATGLNFSNTAAGGKFDVSTLTAAKVENITVDAGDGGFEITATAGNMDALTNITVTGNSAVSLNLDGSAKSFDSISADTLQGNLTVDLAGMTLGTTTEMTITGATAFNNTITLTGGADKLVYTGGTGDDTIDGGAGADTITVNGNGTFKITGGAGADVITLSDGQDTVIYTATGDFGGSNADYAKVELIHGFDSSSDVIQFAVDLIGVTAAAKVVFADVASNAAISAGKVNEIVWGGTYAVQDGHDAADVVAVLGSMGISGVVSNASASSNNALIAIDDGTNTYLWQYSGADASAAIDSGEIKLVGVLDGVSGTGAFVEGNVMVVA